MPYRTGYGFLGTGLAEDDHQRRGRDHNDLNDLVHLHVQVCHLRQENSEHDDAQQRTEEDIDRAFRLFRDLFVQDRSAISVDIRTLLRILELGLENRIFVKVFTAFVRRSRSCHQATQTRRYSDHQHLRDRHVKTVGVIDGDERHYCCCNRRTGDTYLRSDRRHAARTLRTDTFLERDITDNRHQGIHNVAGSYEDGQEERSQRSKECDMIGVLTKHFLCQLNQPIHTSGRLHNTGAGHSSDDDVDDVRRRCSGLHAERENEDGQTDTGDGAERQTTVTRTHP